jgi:thymidylate kinase
VWHVDPSVDSTIAEPGSVAVRRSWRGLGGPSIRSHRVDPVNHVESERAATSGDALALVRELVEALDEHRIRYCHWKSTRFLDRSLSGDNDLDLLVHRDDAETFVSIMSALDFKQARLRDHELPGIDDYYGYDPTADVVVHVHAHYRLVIGDDLTKNYRLPLEEAVIADSLQEGPLPVPIPEAELFLLLVRLVVKHCTWDAALLRRSSIPPSAREELSFLRARADHATVRTIFRDDLPRVTEALVDECSAALEPDSTFVRKVRTGRHMSRALRPYARRPRPVDVALKVGRFLSTGTRRRLGARRPRRRLVASGPIVAVVGSDGAGKSTLVHGLDGWLGRYVASRAIHLGRPPKTWSTWTVRATMKLTKSLARGDRATGVERTLRMLLAVSIARDRRLAYTSALRASLAGVVVVSDRFPIRDLTLMDGPRVPQLAGNRNGRLIRGLIRSERRQYDCFVAPDLLIALAVDFDTAATRRADEEGDLLRSRWEDVERVDWEALGAHVLDGSGDAAVVLARAKRLVWASL